MEVEQGESTHLFDTHQILDGARAEVQLVLLRVRGAPLRVRGDSASLSVHLHTN